MSLLQRVMFEAPWWSIAINAHFVPRRALHRAIAEVAADLRGRILDAGCGTQPYRRLLREASQVVGVDLSRTEGRRPDVLFDGHRLPFRDGSFDGVLCNQVLEHVFTPEQFLRELLRVLAPGGRLVLTVPFAWGEHEQPHDAARYTSFGLRDLLERAGFRLRCQRKLVGGVAAMAALLADQMNRGLRRWPAPLRLALRALLIAPVSLAGWALVAWRSSEPSSFYLDNLAVAEKPGPA